MLSSFTSPQELNKKEQKLVDTLIERGFSHKDIKKISELNPDSVREYTKFLKKVEKQLQKMQPQKEEPDVNEEVETDATVNQ